MSGGRPIGTWRDAALGRLLRPVRKALGARLGAARRHRDTVVEQVDGLPFLVLPDVFNPVLFRSGSLLAAAARDELDAWPRSVEPPRVLDVGTGSGVAAVFAAIRGAEVEAVDLNPQAVRCARLNANLHQVEDRVDVHEGDLFEPVQGKRFDLVTFNPPFRTAPPESFLEAAYRGGDLTERFAAGLGAVLAPDGRALVVLCTEAGCQDLVRRLKADGLAVEEAARTRWFGELLVVVRAQRP